MAVSWKVCGSWVYIAIASVTGCVHKHAESRACMAQSCTSSYIPSGLQGLMADRKKYTSTVTVSP